MHARVCIVLGSFVVVLLLAPGVVATEIDVAICKSESSYPPKLMRSCLFLVLPSMAKKVKGRNGR